MTLLDPRSRSDSDVPHPAEPRPADTPVPLRASRRQPLGLTALNPPAPAVITRRIDPTDLRRRTPVSSPGSAAHSDDLPTSLAGGGESRRSRADIARTLTERAEYLDPPERTLIHSVYRDGLSVKALALAATPGLVIAPPAAASEQARSHSRIEHGSASNTGIESLARTLRRRVRQIAARVLSPIFVFVVAHLDPSDPGERRRLGLPCWSPTRRKIAQACVVRGLSFREAASELRVSLHTVRREMQSVRALFEEQRA